MDQLEALLANLPGYDLLTREMKEHALAGALIPDSNGVWPGDDEYETTYDTYYAAINLLGFLQAQPFVTQVSSEGTSTAVQPPNWVELARFYRSQSHIARAVGTGVLSRVTIPDVSHVHRTNMKDRGQRYGDVDTDLG